METGKATEVLKRVGTIAVKGYKDTLRKYKKYATKKTHDSIEYEISINDKELSVKIFAAKSLIYIEFGRRKGAKLPVQKVNGSFELVPELKEWVKAVGYGGSHYYLAKIISERGIKAIPITDIVIQTIEKEIQEIMIDWFKIETVNKMISTVKRNFQ